jgi:ribosomal protein S18 acetylase RimI-like enzyme
MHINGPLFNIRPETELDKDFLARLYRSTRDDLLQIGLPEAMLANLLAMQFNAQQSSYRKQYPDACCTIIEESGGPIGCMIVNRGDDAIRLVYIALLPQARNRGYGRGLIQALQDEALSANKALTLSVSTQNVPAQRLYARMEFETGGNSGANLEMIWNGR